MTLYFVSSNTQKHDDVRWIFRNSKSPPQILDRKLDEVLSHELDEVVKKKATEAYKAIQMPLFVEHGALYAESLNDLPGPMVKLFWEKLRGGLCAIIPAGKSRHARVEQAVCYCDGKTLRVFKGKTEGEIAHQPRGTGGIHWESMFIPRGSKKTLGEMKREERINAQAFTQAYMDLRKRLSI